MKMMKFFLNFNFNGDITTGHYFSIHTDTQPFMPRSCESARTAC